MDDLLLFSEIILMGVCVLLLIMNLYTYRRTKNRKVLIVSGMFILFFIQALMALLSEFIEIFDFIKEARVLIFVDVLAVIIIYAAIVKS